LFHQRDEQPLTIDRQKYRDETEPMSQRGILTVEAFNTPGKSSRSNFSRQFVSQADGLSRIGWLCADRLLSIFSVNFRTLHQV
jgi:hypothetical protein